MKSLKNPLYSLLLFTIIMVISSYKSVEAHASKGIKNAHKAILKQNDNGGDFPPNPVNKAGWTITADDEFDGPTLNQNLWIPYYLRQRTTDDVARANYEITDGKLILKIIKKGNVVSALQTLEKKDLHKIGTRVDFPDRLLFTQKYGYFEIRAKTQAGEGYCSAFWLVGVQGDPTQSAEIDVLEQPGSLGNNTYQANLYNWKDRRIRVPAGASGWKGKYHFDRDLTSTFNIYGVDWSQDGIKFYFNNKLIKSIPYAPQYPMGVILSFYQGNAWYGNASNTTTPYPKEFVIDYFRAYQKN